MIVDDHRIVRTGLESLISDVDHLDVVASVGTLDDMYTVMKSNRTIDLIILDLKLDHESGITGLIQLKKTWPKTKVLILSGFIDHHLANEAMRLDVDGYLLKSTNFNYLLQAIDRILKGDHVYDDQVTLLKNDDNHKISAFSNLSHRKVELLKLLCLGKTNKEIASILGLTEKTIRNYLSILYKRINVSNRSEAVSYYMRRRDV